MRKESSCGVKKIRFETEMFRVNLASRFWSSLVMFLWPPLLYGFCGVVAYIFFRHLLR